MTRLAVALFTLGLLVAPVTVEAQPAEKVYRIGYLGINPFTASTQPLWDAFILGLRDHGYILSKNITIETRFSQGNVI